MEIEEIKKLVINPDELLLIKVNSGASESFTERLGLLISKHFPDVNYIIHREDVSFSKLIAEPKVDLKSEK